MSLRCCPRCRLLQPESRCVDCRTGTEALRDLTRPQFAGVTAVTKQPATGWRDQVALWSTALGMLGAAVAGALITSSPVGLLAGPAVGAFGYTKQFWRTALKRRPRLGTVEAPAPPPGPAIVGVAQPFERTVAGGALAIATTIENRHGVIARLVDAAAFWLVADRRFLVTGNCWVAGVAGRSWPRSTLLHELAAGGFPIGHVKRAGLRIHRVAVMPGDRIAVNGRPSEEAIAGLGYRDAVTDALRGEPGRPVWIDRLGD